MFTANPPGETWVETDADGLWEFHGEKLWSVSIGQSKKEGYVFEKKLYPDVTVHRGLIYDTSPDNRAVTVLRKKKAKEHF